MVSIISSPLSKWDRKKMKWGGVQKGGSCQKGYGKFFKGKLSENLIYRKI